MTKKKRKLRVIDERCRHERERTKTTESAGTKCSGQRKRWSTLDRYIDWLSTDISIDTDDI